MKRSQLREIIREELVNRPAPVKQVDESIQDIISQISNLDADMLQKVLTGALAAAPGVALALKTGLNIAKTRSVGKGLAKTGSEVQAQQQAGS